METPEQAPSTPPPKRRRRWLTVSVVLVLVSTVAWWYWPRGDARFVGKWEVFSNGKFDSPSEVYDFGGRIVELASLAHGQLPAWSDSYRWSSYDETLELRSGLPQRVDSVLGPVLEWLWIRTGWSVRHRSRVYSFRFAADEKSVVLRRSGKRDMLLKRLPE